MSCERALCDEETSSKPATKMHAGDLVRAVSNEGYLVMPFCLFKLRLPGDLSSLFVLKQFSAADIEIVVPLSYSLAQSLQERIQFRASNLQTEARYNQALAQLNRAVLSEQSGRALGVVPEDSTI